MNQLNNVFVIQAPSPIRCLHFISQQCIIYCTSNLISLLSLITFQVKHSLKLSQQFTPLNIQLIKHYTYSIQSKQGRLIIIQANQNDIKVIKQINTQMFGFCKAAFLQKQEQKMNIVYIDEQTKTLVITNIETQKSQKYPLDNEISNISFILIQPLQETYNIFVFTEGVKIHHYILNHNILSLKKQIMLHTSNVVLDVKIKNNKLIGIIRKQGIFILNLNNYEVNIQKQQKFLFRMLIGQDPYLVESKVVLSSYEDLKMRKIKANFGNWLLSDAKVGYGMLIAGYQNNLIGIIVLESQN